MAASKYDFAIEQGTSFKLSIIYKDSNSTPINLANYCARITWKTNTGSVQVFSSDNAFSQNVYSFIINDEEGKITFMLPSHTTNGFSFNSAKYDLELQSNEPFYGDGTENQGGKYTIRLLFGTISIVKRYSQTSNDLDCAT
jgi:hypothetical protein